jgi:hypothetical protein
MFSLFRAQPKVLSLFCCLVAFGAGTAACSFETAPPAGPSQGSPPKPRTTIVYPPRGTDPNTGMPGGAGTPDGGMGCGSNLTGVVRDFKQAHADFEEFSFIGDDRGMVEAQLGPDHKPVYAGKPKTPTTSGRANFDQWFRDVAGVNQGVFITLPFQDRGGGLWTYDNSEFFPIDGMF